MSAMSNPHLVAQILRDNGYFPGDPQITSAWVFQNENGQEGYAIFHDERYNDIYSSSPYVIDPVALFQDGQVTEQGREFIKKWISPKE